MAESLSDHACIGPATAAVILEQRGIGLIAEDRHIIEALIAGGVSSREIPDDLAPVRAELRSRIEQRIADPLDPAHLDAVSGRSGTRSFVSSFNQRLGEQSARARRKAGE